MSSFILKILAIFFMIIDHVGFVLFPNIPAFRIIGRLAFPLFAYQMAVGFSHTKKKEKHILKLLFFSILCQIPYALTLSIYHLDGSLNILFTFVIALLILYLFENLFGTENTLSKNLTTFTKLSYSFLFLGFVIVLLFLACQLPVDYTWYGVLLTVAFYFTLKRKDLAIFLFFLLVNLNYFFKPTLMHFYAYFSLLDIIFILAFNGKRGYKHPLLFYLFYFLHFFPLLLLKYFA